MVVFMREQKASVLIDDHRDPVAIPVEQKPVYTDLFIALYRESERNTEKERNNSQQRINYQSIVEQMSSSTTPTPNSNPPRHPAQFQPTSTFHCRKQGWRRFHGPFVHRMFGKCCCRRDCVGIVGSRFPSRTRRPWRPSGSTSTNDGPHGLLSDHDHGYPHLNFLFFALHCAAMRSTFALHSSYACFIPSVIETPNCCWA